MSAEKNQAFAVRRTISSTRRRLLRRLQMFDSTVSSLFKQWLTAQLSKTHHVMYRRWKWRNEICFHYVIATVILPSCVRMKGAQVSLPCFRSRQTQFQTFPSILNVNKQPLKSRVFAWKPIRAIGDKSSRYSISFPLSTKPWGPVRLILPTTPVTPTRMTWTRS